MGTVCYAPEIPVIDRAINPYLNPQFTSNAIRTTMNNSLVSKMAENYNTPQTNPAPMNPYHLNQLSISGAPAIISAPQPPSVTIVQQPVTIQQTNPILQKLHSSPEAPIHGPPTQLASPCDMPPVTQFIMERRKRLQMFKFEGQSKGAQLGPYRYHADGIIYFGQWRNGTPHGKGIIYFPDGSVFEGGFIDGQSIGKGRLISRNGDYYQGDVSSNVASGIGVSQNNIIRYEGEFQNNLPHGQGVQTSLDGRSRFVGTFYQGSKVSGVLTWGNNGQFVYEGRFANNTFNGRGVLRSSNGTYIGDFVNGHQQGVGQMYGPDGTVVYRGNWINDNPTDVTNGVYPQQGYQ